jgi:hypothetical protein
MHTSLGQQLVIGPRVWPGARAPVQLGDLSGILPSGIGISAPLPIRPWDDPFDRSRENYYGLQKRIGEPFHDAPLTAAAGGVVYFDAGCTADDLGVLCRLLALGREQRDYAAFLEESDDPLRDRWLVQLRIVSRFALRYLFGLLGKSEYERFPSQSLTAFEALAAFLRDQEHYWLDGSSQALAGAAGGDGDWARETLGFGLMVENEYHGVYRIWSRAWLVTK